LAEVAVTRPGDLWILGAHRLLCGSALSGEDCSRLMAGGKAQFVITGHSRVSVSESTLIYWIFSFLVFSSLGALLLQVYEVSSPATTLKS
jgi:hypothetical protein